MRNARGKQQCRLLAITLVAGVCSVGPHARADAISELDDAVARMQFAYFTNDARELAVALESVATLQLPSSMKGITNYFSAYGQWRLAELHSNSLGSGSRSAHAQVAQAANACEDAAKAALAADPRMAEAHALTAICDSFNRPDSSNVPACSKHKGLRTARELAPNNPRVLLIDSQCAAQDDKTITAASIERLTRVVRSFESAPPSQPGRPDWGHAEALVLLGEAHLAQRDTVAARDVLERALVIAPDYEKAKSVLRAATR